MITRIGELLYQKGYPIEYLHALKDYQAVEGVIVPELRLGIIDGNTEHLLIPQYPGARDHYINLGEHWIEEKIARSRKQLIELKDYIQNKLEQVHSELSQAKKIHEQKEKIFISAMDFSKANRVAEQLISNIFATPANDYSNKRDRHFFLGASTAAGAINYIDNITQHLMKRYIIKGRSGSGKSTIMHKVANKAKKAGLEVEYYHCSFDPISLDMIIVPALSVAVLDGTTPHVIDPSRPGDEVIDMFLLTIDPQVEIKYESELSKLNTMYRCHIQTATSHLEEIKESNDLLDELYMDAIDLKAHSQTENKWITKILHFIDK